jgi:hypothetical protein
MTRAGSYTYNAGRWVVEDVGNVATAEAEWPSGDQALTVAFAAPLKAPPAYCAMEGSDGDIGAAVFCETGDDTEIPGAREGPSGLEVGPDGKIGFLVDEACAGEEEI